jgi:hypothetical protein
VTVTASALDWLLESDEPGTVFQAKRDLKERRLADGRWRPGDRCWKPPGKAGSNVEVLDWGAGPSEPLTLNALRVLRAAT